jgi:hypothetical protein
MPAVGGVIFWLTEAVAVAVQPFVASVTVTLYVLTVEVVILAVVAPVLHT